MGAPRPPRTLSPHFTKTSQHYLAGTMTSMCDVSCLGVLSKVHDPFSESVADVQVALSYVIPVSSTMSTSKMCHINQHVMNHDIHLVV